MTEQELKTLRRDPDGLLTYEYLANHIGECGPEEIDTAPDIPGRRRLRERIARYDPKLS